MDVLRPAATAAARASFEEYGRHRDQPVCHGRPPYAASLLSAAGLLRGAPLPLAIGVV